MNWEEGGKEEKNKDKEKKPNTMSGGEHSPGKVLGMIPSKYARTTAGVCVLVLYGVHYRSSLHIPAAGRPAATTSWDHQACLLVEAAG